MGIKSCMEWEAWEYKIIQHYRPIPAHMGEGNWCHCYMHTHKPQDAQPGTSCRRWTRAADCLICIVLQVLLYTDVNAQCNKLAKLIGRTSTAAIKYCQLSTDDCRYRTLTKRPPFSQLCWRHIATIDWPWRKCQSPGFGTKFHGEVPLFRRYPNFSKRQCRISRRKLPCPKPARFVRPFRQNSRLVTDTNRHKAMYRASRASRGSCSIVFVWRQLTQQFCGNIHSVILQWTTFKWKDVISVFPVLL